MYEADTLGDIYTYRVWSGSRVHDARHASLTGMPVHDMASWCHETQAGRMERCYDDEWYVERS